MNEILLFIAVAIVLIASQFLVKRIKAPLLHYVRASNAIALLVLVWASNTDGRLSVKVILSALMLGVLFREYSTKKAPAKTDA